MRLLEQGDDLVIGDRGAPGSVYFVDQTVARRLASSAFTTLISTVVVPGVRDTQCGLKGFRAEISDFIFRRARLDRFAFDVEVVYLALEHHFSLGRLPVVLEHAEESTLRLHWDSLIMLYEVAQNQIERCSGPLPLMRGAARSRSMDLEALPRAHLGLAALRWRFSLASLRCGSARSLR